MSRFITVHNDSETIGAVLSMSEDIALLNTPPGYTLVKIDPSSDPGGIISQDALKIDLSGTVPVFMDTGTELPTENPSLTGLILSVVQP